MPTIESRPSGTVGHVALGWTPNMKGYKTPEAAVHDGDTVSVRPLGNFGVRFLGVDAPEISFELPGRRGFVKTTDPRWEEFLSDPFADRYGAFSPALDPELRGHLAVRCRAGTGRNHGMHAVRAWEGLQQEVAGDMQRQGKDPETFRFFVNFAHEVLDSYGRLLGFINVEQKETPRPLSYNERLLERALVLPYMIWPNVNPFRRQPTLIDAVPEPGSAGDWATRDNALAAARRWVAEAREAKIGVFRPRSRLRLEAFELRFLSRRKPPDRWVMDLSSDRDDLLPPQRYFELSTEDRLYIPAEYVPLFTGKGWRAPGFAPDEVPESRVAVAG